MTYDHRRAALEASSSEATASSEPPLRVADVDDVRKSTRILLQIRRGIVPALSQLETLKGGWRKLAGLKELEPQYDAAWNHYDAAVTNLDACLESIHEMFQRMGYDE